MTAQEKYTNACSQLRRSESDEWYVIDGQDVSDMLNHKMAEKEVGVSLYSFANTFPMLTFLQHNFHEGLAVRTKVDSVVGARSPEVDMTASEEPEVRVENDEDSGRTTFGIFTGVPAPADLINHAKDLRKALDATAMAEDEAQNTNAEQEDLIDLDDSFEAPEHFPDFEPPAPKSCGSMNQYTPKSFNEAVGYLDKVKVCIS